MQPQTLVRPRFTSGLAAILVVAIAASARAQLPQARLYSVFPPGGKVGSTVEVKIAGADMDEAEALVFGHPGIKAVPKTTEVAGEQRPVDGTFVVTIAGNVPPGLHEVRLKGLYGVSNPRMFAVGKNDELTETESNNDFDKASPAEIGKTVNAVLNGGADIDVFKFAGKKGQRIVVEVFGRRLDSRIDPVLEVYDPNRRLLVRSRNDVRGDAIANLELPADGEYFVKLYDFVYGGSTEYFYRLAIDAGPHVDFVFPPAGAPGSNGNYTLYGRNLPGGQPSGVKLNGRDLQKLTVKIPLPNQADKLDVISALEPQSAGMDAISYRLKSPAGDSNAVLVYLATAPVTAEKEPNDEPAQSQKLTAPFELAGQFGKRGDVDHVSFEAKAGEVYYVEVYGQRQVGNSTDPYFVLEQITRNDKGEESAKRITAQDDYTAKVDNNRPNPVNNIISLNTVDPVYRFQVPADGEYRIQVRDRYFESRGDASLVYRLCVRPEAPDFRLLAVPSAPVAKNQQPAPGSVAVRKGENVSIPIAALKRDGFEGVIDLKLEGLPKGITATGAVIGPGDIGTRLVLTAAENAEIAFGDVKIVGTARVLDPAKTRAIEATTKSIPTLEKALPPLRQAADKATQALDKAKQDFDTAKKASDARADDANLKKKAEAAKQNLDKATATAKTATDAVAAKEKEIADARASIDRLKNERDASAKAVTRIARVATVVWQGQQNVRPTTLRLSPSLTVSVVDEVSPFQVTTDVTRVEVNQGRQVLVPVKAFKRDGFDEQINLTFQGLPKNANIDLQNANIAKGSDSQLLRLFVKNNGLAGAYTVYLNAQSSVNYVRNPKRVEREKARQAKIDETLKVAQEAKKAADTAKQAADKAATDAANALKAAQQKMQQADANAKSKPDDAAAKQAAEQAKQALAAADTASKAATEAKTKADAAAKTADDEVKNVTNVKKTVDADLKKATDAAKPKKMNVTPPSTPIVLIVKPAPVQLTASVPGGGNLKKGQKLEIKVTVKRVAGFTGPVTLTLPALPNVSGLSAGAVTIPPDQTEGVIAVQAAGNATEGQIPNAVLRATMDFEGKAAVDVPVTIKVSK